MEKFLLIIAGIFNGSILWKWVYYTFKKHKIVEETANREGFNCLFNFLGCPKIFLSIFSILLSGKINNYFLIGVSIGIFISIFYWIFYINTLEGKNKIIQYKIKKIEKQINNIKKDNLTTEQKEAVEILNSTISELKKTKIDNKIKKSANSIRRISKIKSEKINKNLDDLKYLGY